MGSDRIRIGLQLLVEHDLCDPLFGVMLWEYDRVR